MKKIFIAFVALLIVIAGIVLVQNYFKTNSFKINTPFQNQKNPRALINSNAFEVIIANTPKQMQIGLSEISSLPQNKGMIFLFKVPDYYSFWMKNMKISVDIIYINNDKIVTIFNKAKPPLPNENPIVYRPDEPSDKVLQINAGLAEKYNFKKGDKIVLENI